MAADAFTQIRNAVFRDPRLSGKSMGIFGNISTHRDGWGITPELIATQMRDGVNAIRSGLKELEKYGYLQRTQARREDGTMGPVEYYITDMPEVIAEATGGKSRRSSPVDDFPHADEPHAADRPHKKTIPQEDQLEEEHLSLPAVPEQRTTSERENDAAPDHNHTTAVAADAVAQQPPPRATGTDSQQQGQQQPQAASRPPAVPAGPTDAAERIIDAYTAVLGRPLLSATRNRLHGQAAEALAAGYPEDWLTDRARELAAHSWTDLAKHVEKSTAPLPGTAPPAAASSGRPPWCGECGDDMAPAAAGNPRWRTVDGQPCPNCHPDAPGRAPCGASHSPASPIA